ncbi:MAG: sugar phosphate isomerase/epimerase family protein [Fimbriimonadaceae bacterium]
MLKTRTGSFPIGFRRGWSDWQKDLPSVISWSTAEDLLVLDLAGGAAEALPALRAAGFRVGSVDLEGPWSDLASADAGKRRAALAKNEALIAACGAQNYFTVLLPEDPTKPRSENFKLMIAGLNELGPILEKHGGKLVIEGWPGPGALGCTPESYRATLAESGSKAIGINYDPSHLVRMGIDPIRFVEEFADRIYHVHGKDTEIITEGIYEFGTEQPATLAKGHGFGSHSWRYTIPGHGCVRWVRAFEVLAASGYEGCVCIELEDENFNGTEAGEKFALVSGGRFLASC